MFSLSMYTTSIELYVDQKHSENAHKFYLKSSSILKAFLITFDSLPTAFSSCTTVFGKLCNIAYWNTPAPVPLKNFNFVFNNVNNVHILLINLMQVHTYIGTYCWILDGFQEFLNIPKVCEYSPDENCEKLIQSWGHETTIQFVNAFSDDIFYVISISRKIWRWKRISLEGFEFFAKIHIFIANIFYSVCIFDESDIYYKTT